MLATEITKSEKTFFKVLEEFYLPAFDNSDAATQSFSPDTAVICLAYFVKNGMMDEAFLMSLLEVDDTVQNEIKALSGDGKSKKKAEEFREKYLSTRREFLQLQEKYSELQADNLALQSALIAKQDELKSTKDAFQHFQEESLTRINKFQKRIQELENCIAEYQAVDINQTPTILLIMDTDKFSETGTDILTYDNILRLSGIADRYHEILLVVNDLPFSVRRKIYKIDKIREKLITFSTKQEMIEYVRQRRKG